MNVCGYALAIVKDLLLLPLAGYFLYEPLSWKEEEEHSSSSRQTPILLIHGSGFNQSEWLIGRNYLSKKGRKEIYSFDWDKDDSSADIEYYTSSLENKIDDILATRQNRDIILIGHSMGGLMAGHYTEFVAKQKRVNVIKVITIATPWLGSISLEPFVKIRNALNLPEMSKRYQQMLPNSLFLRELEEMVKSSSTPYVTIGSYHDLMVPYPSCHLSYAMSMTSLWGLGHYSIIVSTKLWKHIYSELQ